MASAAGSAASERRSNHAPAGRSASLPAAVTASIVSPCGMPSADNGYTTQEIKKLVGEKLELVEMPGTQKLKPAELSGGMKKRVGLARALITNPDYILYDEPTTGLDPIMSDSIDLLIKDLTEKLNVTSIVVTHDMYSVKNVANKVAMMNEGVIHFVGSQKDLINSVDPIIQEFIKRTEE